MTSDTITLAEARRRLDEKHAAEMKCGLELVEATIQQLAAERGVPVEDVRALMVPHIARQIATMEELHRLAISDLVAISKADPKT